MLDRCCGVQTVERILRDVGTIIGPIQENLVPMSAHYIGDGLLQTRHRFITPVARIDSNHYPMTTGLSIANDLADTESGGWLIDSHGNS